MKRFPTHTAEQTLWTGEALPFNLAGEPIDNSVTEEGAARVRALAEREASKAQTQMYEQNADGTWHFLELHERADKRL